MRLKGMGKNSAMGIRLSILIADLESGDLFKVLHPVIL